MESAVAKQVQEALSWRYATKRFDPTRKISAADWAVLENTLVQSPSSFGLQPWRFVVVENKDLRKKLRAASWNQSQIEEASHLVVFAAKQNLGAAEVEKLIACTAQTRGIPVAALNDYKQMMLGFVARPDSEFDRNAWTARQTYIALGMFLSTAALLKIDACPMEGIDGAAYDEALHLSADGYHTLVVATAGYRAGDDAHANYKKVRYPANEIVKRA